MKLIKVVVIFFLLMFSTLFLKAQAKGIVLTGKVITFEERSPIEGATIQVKGTRNVSGTMYDGMYAIEVKPGDSVLVFSHEGYETKEMPIVVDKREYNVMLKNKPASVAGNVSSSFICNDANKQLLVSCVLVHK
jgi:ABC-type oligopeptide transport system substrate-binding subunit